MELPSAIVTIVTLGTIRPKQRNRDSGESPRHAQNPPCLITFKSSSVYYSSHHRTVQFLSITMSPKLPLVSKSDVKQQLTTTEIVNSSEGSHYHWVSVSDDYALQDLFIVCCQLG